MPYSATNNAMLSIHQYAPNAVYGDGITNGMLFIQRILKKAGISSEIYSHFIADELKSQVLPADQIDNNPEQILLYHFSMGHDYADWIENLVAKKVLIYHNITPAHFFATDSAEHIYALKGRTMLKTWSQENDFYCGCIGDSPINSQELIELGFKNVQTIPLLVDKPLMLTAPFDEKLSLQHSHCFSLLFVGRIVENKCQMELLDIFEQFCRWYALPAELLIVGGVFSQKYEQQLQQAIVQKGLGGKVKLTGKVSNEALSSYYRNANAYISMSEHEGFGMPLIEAMLFDVPVMAFNSSGISDTMGCGGLLFKQKSIKAIAATLYLIATDKAFKRALIQSQRENCQRFDSDLLLKQLLDFLRQFKSDVPVYETTDKQTIDYQVEGPFDSSYSLAILNREMAKTLIDDDQNIGLLSSEGNGNFAPDPAFFKQYPELQTAWKNSAEGKRAEVVLRYLYPPRTDNLPGKIRILHNFGWEESAFSSEYVEDFNRNCDAITVMSEFVKKVLRHNGVHIPISVVGVGCDHILKSATTPQKSDKFAWLDPNDTHFLHISSCFPRKGVDVLLTSYCQTFSNKDTVCLVIKTFPNPHHNIEQAIDKIRREQTNAPKIVLINEDINEHQITQLYQACDILVAPSRGEGFGLPMAEAMLFNLPVITTGFGGQTDFCHAENSWLIDYRLAKAKTHMGLFNSFWAEPDAQHLSQLMRELFTKIRENDAEVTRRCQQARENMIKHFSWQQVRNRTYQCIDALERQKPFTQKSTAIAWVSTWNSRCGIAEYSRLLTCRFDPDALVILANQDAELTQPDEANVLRCWNTGTEDNLEQLYHTIIEQKCTHVVIQFNFGFFALKAYARLLSRLKQANIRCYNFFHATHDSQVANQTVSLLEIKHELSLSDYLIVHSVDDLNRLKDFDLSQNAMLFPHGVSKLNEQQRQQGEELLITLLKQSKYPQLNRILAVENHQLQRTPNTLILSCFGFLLPHKGISKLIEAFEKIRSKHTNTRLLLLNALYPNPISDDEFRKCQRQMETSQYRQDIIFITDYLEQSLVKVLLSQSDAVIFPYQNTQESSSAAIRGGLSSEKPVLCTPLNIFDDVADVVHFLPGTDADSIARGCLDFIKQNPAKEFWLKKHIPEKVSHIIDKVLPESIVNKSKLQQQWLDAHDWPVLSQRLKNIIQTEVE